MYKYLLKRNINLTISEMVSIIQVQFDYKFNLDYDFLKLLSDEYKDDKNIPDDIKDYIINNFYDKYDLEDICDSIIYHIITNNKYDMLGIKKIIKIYDQHMILFDNGDVIKLFRLINNVYHENNISKNVQNLLQYIDNNIVYYTNEISFDDNIINLIFNEFREIKIIKKECIITKSTTNSIIYGIILNQNGSKDLINLTDLINCANCINDTDTDLEQRIKKYIKYNEYSMHLMEYINI